MRPSAHALAVLVPAVLFGFLVAAQWQTQIQTTAIALRHNAPLSETTQGLQQEQNALRGQLADLRRRLDEIQASAATQSGTTQDLRTRLDELKGASGLSPASGEGVVAHLEGPRVPTAEHTCFATDIADIVNIAWSAGAAAVAVNLERIVGSSSVYCVGATIVVNGAIVSAPFEVIALGRADDLLRTFDQPDQLRELKRRRDSNAVAFGVTRGIGLSVPAFSGALTVRFAEPR